MSHTGGSALLTEEEMWGLLPSERRALMAERQREREREEARARRENRWRQRSADTSTLPDRIAILSAGGIARNTLLRRLHVTAETLNRTLNEMVAAGQIRIEVGASTGGRPRTTIRPEEPA